MQYFALRHSRSPQPHDPNSTTPCSSCGSLCRLGDRYCACCGAQFTAYRRWRYRCATCGAEALSPLANYCSVCGDELRTDLPAENTTDTSAAEPDAPPAR